ncbi:MAG: hypothetical protein OEV42_09265 [Deltaproteobacteria bacterium]|nr:hypothetical protein [Deltaproteobacteria bacterium]
MEKIKNKILWKNRVEIAYVVEIKKKENFLFTEKKKGYFYPSGLPGKNIFKAQAAGLEGPAALWCCPLIGYPAR